VRELENVIERAVVLSSGQEIGVELLPDQIAGRGTPFPVLDHRPDASLFDILEDCERRIITDMLEKCNWNQTEAAERFHVPLSTLNQKIKRLILRSRRRGESRKTVVSLQSSVSSLQPSAIDFQLSVLPIGMPFWFLEPCLRPFFRTPGSDGTKTRDCRLEADD